MTRFRRGVLMNESPSISKHRPRKQNARHPFPLCAAALPLFAAPSSMCTLLLSSLALIAGGKEARRYERRATKRRKRTKSKRKNENVEKSERLVKKKRHTTLLSTPWYQYDVKEKEKKKKKKEKKIGKREEHPTNRGMFLYISYSRRDRLSESLGISILYA